MDERIEDQPPEVVETPDGAKESFVAEESDYEVMSPEQALAYAQRHRRGVIDHLVKGGLPGDPKEQKVLLSALKDMDQTALTQQRQKIDETNSDTARDVADAMGQMVTHLQNRDPFRRDDGSGDVAPIPKADPEKLGHHPKVNGEDFIGAVNETYEEFMARMEREADGGEDNADNLDDPE